MTAARSRLGLAGLLAFEALLVLFTLSAGAIEFALTGLAGAALLAYALWRSPSAIVYGGLAIATLSRAALQATGVFFPAKLWPTFLVPAGFGLLATGGRGAALAGASLVALARSWFSLVYFENGNLVLAVANVLGATGAWILLADLRDEKGAVRAAAA